MSPCFFTSFENTIHHTQRYLMAASRAGAGSYYQLEWRNNKPLGAAILLRPAILLRSAIFSFSRTISYHTQYGSHGISWSCNLICGNPLLYRQRSPKWNESIRLERVLFSFTHAHTRTFCPRAPREVHSLYYGKLFLHLDIASCSFLIPRGQGIIAGIVLILWGERLVYNFF